MKLELSKKVKWGLLIGFPCALLLSVWIGTSDEVDRLIYMSKKADYETRLSALHELAAYGPAASDATDALISHIMSGDGAIRRAAANALIQIDRRAAVAGFTEAMGSSNPGVRLDAREALESIQSRKAQSVVATISQKSEARQQRARINTGWFKKMKKQFKQKKERQYRQHRRIYRDPQ